MSLSEETTSQSIKMLQIYVNILIWLGLGHETIVILYSHLINLIFTPYLAHHMLRRNNNYKTIEYDLDICLGVISGKHVLFVHFVTISKSRDACRSIVKNITVAGGCTVTRSEASL